MAVKYNNQICALLKARFVRIGSMFPFGELISVILQTAETSKGPWSNLPGVYRCDCDIEIQNGKKMMVLKGKHLLAAIKKE